MSKRTKGRSDVTDRDDRLNAEGHETLDPRPVEIPAGFKRPDTLAEQVQRLVRNEFSEMASAQGFETFEEADDFDVEDDDEIDVNTPFEVEFDPVLGREVTPADFADAEKAEYIRKRYEEADLPEDAQENLESFLARAKEGVPSDEVSSETKETSDE